jgi:hypothetical protein
MRKATTRRNDEMRNTDILVGVCSELNGQKTCFAFLKRAIRIRIKSAAERTLSEEARRIGKQRLNLF